MNAESSAGVWTLPLRSNEQVAESTSWLSFESPTGVACEPGQFFMLSPASSTSRVFLGRPLSIGDVRDGRWWFMLRSLGSGSAWLRSRKKGALLRLVGPLGRPFQPPARPVHRMVAGGIGLAPFFYLARRIRERQQASRIELYYGERSGPYHTPIETDLAALFDYIARFSDDGSAGSPGTVLDGLPTLAGEDQVAWYGCGPNRMLKALADRLESIDVRGAQFSLEERMGCGFGVCQACIVRNRKAPPTYRLLCVDGPVVDPRGIAW